MMRRYKKRSFAAMLVMQRTKGDERTRRRVVGVKLGFLLQGRATKD
jgi:hypothetical protein